MDTGDKNELCIKAFGIMKVAEGQIYRREMKGSRI